MLIKENGDILTRHFHIWTNKEKLMCIFEIYLKGEYILLEYKNHKLYSKDTWII